MPVDMKKWVEGLGLPEADAKAVFDAIGKGGEKTATYIEGNQLRQDEFSRKMNDQSKEVEKLQLDLKKKMEEEDRFHNSLSDWDVKRKKELADAKTARERAEQVLAAARDKLGKISTDYGVPENEISALFEGVPATRTDNPPPRMDVDVSNFVTKEEFNNEAKAYAKLSTLVPKLDREYFRLFGEKAEDINWEMIIEKTLASKGAMNIKQVVEQEYKFSEKRAEIQKTEIDERIKKARQEGEESARAKILAENPTLSDRGGRSGEREGSPVLAVARRQMEEAAKTGKAPAPASQSPVQAAVAAFNDGKYKSDKAA